MSQGSTRPAAWVNHIAGKTKGWRQALVQRVRIGLTGLAFVFILVLLGAVFSRSTTNDSPIPRNTIDGHAPGRPRAATPRGAGVEGAPRPPPAGPATSNEAQPKEPLAQLGLAPGNADQNGS